MAALATNTCCCTNQNLEYTHTGKLKRYHPKSASKSYHPGKKIWTHSQHPGAHLHRAKELTNEDNWFAKGVGVLGYAEAVGTLGLATLLYSGLTKVAGTCGYCDRKMSSGGCMWVYDCCNNYESHEGCKSFENNKIKYLCCKEEKHQSEGCYGYYTCCPNKEFQIRNGKPIGCAKKCSKCGKIAVSKSIKHKYGVNQYVVNVLLVCLVFSCESYGVLFCFLFGICLLAFKYVLEKNETSHAVVDV